MNTNTYKVLLIVSVLLLFTGCMKRGSVNFIEEERVITGISFQKYSDKGFLITSGDYGADFESVGMFTFTIYPRANRLETERTVVTKDSSGNEIKEVVKEYEWIKDRPDIQRAFDFIYDEALSRNADGIINLKVESTYKTFWDGNYPENLEGIKIEGYLIRRARSNH